MRLAASVTDSPQPDAAKRPARQQAAAVSERQSAEGDDGTEGGGEFAGAGAFFGRAG